LSELPIAIYPSTEQQLVRVYPDHFEVVDTLINHWFQLKGSAFGVVYLVLLETLVKQREWVPLTVADFLTGIGWLKTPKMAKQAINSALKQGAILVKEQPGQPEVMLYALNLSGWSLSRPIEKGETKKPTAQWNHPQ
jgi:hypothetical protein